MWDWGVPYVVIVENSVRVVMWKVLGCGCCDGLFICVKIVSGHVGK